MITKRGIIVAIPSIILVIVGYLLLDFNVGISALLLVYGMFSLLVCLESFLSEKNKGESVTPVTNEEIKQQLDRIEAKL